MLRIFTRHDQLARLFACLLASSISHVALGQEPPPAEPTAEASINELLERLNEQQADIAAQRELMETQSAALQNQQRQLEVQQAEMQQQTDTIAKQAEQLNDQRKAIQQLQARVDVVEQIDPGELSEEEVRIRARLESLEETMASGRDRAETTFDAESFPGSVPIPGTTSALKVGGFVKMNIVQSFDPIGSSDRFIAGSIPTEDISSANETSLTVSQSRLNFELRDRTGSDTVRAFIEGDFAGNGDTFRLRHAFGQFRDLMAGKTFSTFMDTQAIPEDIDFEGINGQINVRQAQLRYFPRIGRDWNLLFSVEDPDPDITGGEGISQIPDVVASAQRTWFDRWHVKSTAVLRNISARETDPDTGDVLPGADTEKATGWGLSISGNTAVPFWDERDNFMFQFNYGEGLGRYVNDLGTVGGQDAIFDPNGNLETIPVFAGYLAFQKWWRDSLRSTFVASWVDVDNFGYQADDAYAKTRRISGNLVFSPTPRIDIGTELIWGLREDKDGDDGDASQLQISAKYRF